MKSFISIAALLLAQSVFAGYRAPAPTTMAGCLDCFNFVAPTVSGAENVNPAEVGLIVFDYSFNMFRAFNGTSWSKLTNEKSIRTVTNANATLSVTDDVVIVSVSASGYTITLPVASAVGVGGKEYTIKKTDNSMYPITIDGNTKTIDGSATKKLYTQNELIRIVSDGSNWQIVERRIPSEWTSYTPTGNWSTVTTYTGQWRRVGSDIEVDAKVALSGTPSGTFTLLIPYPAILTIDTNKMTDGVATEGIGMGIAMDSGTDYPIIVKVFSTTSVFAMATITSSTYGIGYNVNSAGPFAFGSGDYVSIRFKVPISGWEG